MNTYYDQYPTVLLQTEIDGEKIEVRATEYKDSTRWAVFHVGPQGGLRPYKLEAMRSGAMTGDLIDVLNQVRTIMTDRYIAKIAGKELK